MRRIALALTLLALAPMSARAEDTEPAFRVGGGLNLLTWNAVTIDVGSTRQETDSLAIGLVTPSLSLDVGALVTSWLAIGLVGQGSYASQSASSSLSYHVLAYAEASWHVDFARPFLRVYGGIAGSETNVAPPVFSPGPTGTTTTTIVQGAVGGGIGAHCFATPDFSISPYLAVLYYAGDANESGTAFSSQTVSLQLGVSFLGWID